MSPHTPRLSFSRAVAGALAVATLGLASLAAVSVVSEEPAAAAASRGIGTLSVSPDNYVGGQLLTWKGNVGGPGVRSLVLQSNLGRAGDSWNTVDGFRSKTRSDGSFEFTRQAPGMFGVLYRVKAGPYVTRQIALDAKTPDLTIAVTGQSESDVRTNEPGRVAPGEDFGITVDTTPGSIFRSPQSAGLPVFLGRTLTLQKRVDGDTWQDLGTTEVESSGLGFFTGLSEDAGVVVYRVREEDVTSGGNKIGWMSSFPLYVYVGTSPSDRTAAPAEQSTADPTASRSLAAARRRGGSPATATAGQVHGWAPATWDFTWEEGQSLTSPPGRGASHQGGWLDYSDGSGRVSKQNGGLMLDSSRYNGEGPGDFGTTRATLYGQDLAQGRWETRLRLRSAYERAGRDYAVVAELVPARASDYACGSHNITIARLSAFSRTFQFGARNGSTRWDGSATTPATLLDAAYTFAVEVTDDHVTWFLNSKPVGSVTGGKAYSGVPMTLRLSLEGDEQNEMNQISLISDWQRGFTIGRGREVVADQRLAPQATASGC